MKSISILVEPGEQRYDGLVKLAEIRKTSPNKLIGEAIDALLKRAPELNVSVPAVDKPSVNAKMAEQFEAFATVRGRTPQAITREFRRTPEDLLVKKYTDVNQKMLRQLIRFVQDGHS
jgi:hypothetical protein